MLPVDVTLPAGVVGVPLSAPCPVHRTELLHGQLASDAARSLASHLGGAAVGN